MRALGKCAALAAAGLLLVPDAWAEGPPPDGGDPWADALELSTRLSTQELARKLRELQKKIQALADRATPVAEALEALHAKAPKDIGRWGAEREPLHHQAYAFIARLEELGGELRKVLYAYEYGRVGDTVEDMLARRKRQLSPRDMADDTKLRSFEISVRRLQQRLAEAMSRDATAFEAALQDRRERRRNLYLAGLLSVTLALAGLAAWRLQRAPPDGGG